MIIIGNVEVEAIIGDIVMQSDLEAIVNAANSKLQTGGGVAGAIHNAAGPGLAKECQAFAPIKPGEVVITSAHYLPNDYVIHCLGPIYGVDKPEDVLLADCYNNAIRLCEEKQIQSVAFPAISTGAFGYPFESAADIAISVVAEKCLKARYLKIVRFVLINHSDMMVYRNKLNNEL